jgi:hypothetical protein
MNPADELPGSQSCYGVVGVAVVEPIFRPSARS